MLTFTAAPIKNFTFNPWNLSFYATYQSPDHEDQGQTIWFFGNDENNRFIGDGFADQMFGGEGRDYLYGGGGNDSLFGGSDRDRLYGGEGDDDMFGGDGADFLFGGSGADLIDGGAGDDTVSYTSSLQGVNVNLALGQGSGGDAQGDTFVDIEIVYGSSFGDTLIGDTGRNIFYGGAGSDVIDGAAGNDGILGGRNTTFAGDDLRGGFGNDSFWFYQKDSGGTYDGMTYAADLIRDFDTAGDDRLFFSKIGIDEADWRLDAAGNSTIIRVFDISGPVEVEKYSVVLENTPIALIDQDDVFFF